VILESDKTSGPTGYAAAEYAESLMEFGTPRLLPRSGGWVLERLVPGSSYRDATGCYPMFSCRDWPQLNADLAEIGSDLVSLSLVTDPFGDYDLARLNQSFPDLVVPFKQHFVTDLDRDPETFLNSHHRRNVRKALRNVRVESCETPSAFLDDWCRLYRNLIDRHEVSGLSAFSRLAFEKQLKVPGIEAVRAVEGGVTVGMLLWYIERKVAYYHLGAYSERGYDLNASFALFRYSIDYFATRKLAWLNLGGHAGVGANEESGLGRFKRGWSTDTRTAYLCGRIFDRERYEQMTRAGNAGPTKYFPAYRAGEFS
jgi:hypothetical protein